MKEILDFGTAVISSVSVQLQLHFDYDETQSCFKILIPLPYNYPNTKVKQFIEDNKENSYSVNHYLFTMSMQCTHEELAIAQYMLDIKGCIGIYISQFYVLTKNRNITINDDEKLLFRGMGRKALCMTFSFIQKYFAYIDPYQVVVALNADGGRSDAPEDLEKIEEYKSMGKCGLIKIFIMKYPSYNLTNTIQEIINNNSEEYELEILASLLVTIDNNSKLVDYYQNTYGFEKLQGVANGALMGTTMATILSYCNGRKECLNTCYH